MNTKGKQQLDKQNCASKYPKSTTGQVPAVLLVAKEAWCEGRINDNVEAIKHNSSENIDIGKHTVWSANIGCIGALWQETLSGHLQLHFLVLFTPLSTCSRAGVSGSDFNRDVGGEEGAWLLWALDSDGCIKAVSCPRIVQKNRHSK